MFRLQISPTVESGLVALVLVVLGQLRGGHVSAHSEEKSWLDSEREGEGAAMKRRHDASLFLDAAHW
jgi:hypothetical protein